MMRTQDPQCDRRRGPPETSLLSAVLPAGDGQLPLLLKMPPMPTPDRRKTMRSESLVGVLVFIMHRWERAMHIPGYGR